MEQPNLEQYNVNQAKHRHGCATAFLVLMIVANSLIALFYVFGGSLAARTFRGSASWGLPILLFVAVLEVVSAIALWRWKKWGFFGFMILAVVAFIVNLVIGFSFLQCAFGLVGPAILYWTLQMGKEKNTWRQLE